MLRRMQPIVLNEETEPQPVPPPEPQPSPAPPPPFVERRRTERRGMDALRAEALRTVISRVEDKNFGGLRDRVHWRTRMKASRLLLLLIAIVAGGLAAYLATQRDPVVTPAVAQPEPEVVAAPTAKVLVARAEIGIGERLTEASVGWEEWPLSTVHPEYITSEVVPDAVTEMTGSVARSGFLVGEPIRAGKLIEANGGYLSAVLEGGKRGVSVMVNAETAAGGFIAPNDHVDVLLTRMSELGQNSDTILENVRVLAINSRLGDLAATEGAADREAFTGSAIATLELDPLQAEVITAASTMGQLSLVLRSSADMAEPLPADRRAANQVIRLTSPFWKR